VGAADEFGKLVGGFFSYRTPCEYKCIFEGHQIAVRLSSKELKLYIDGEGVDSVPPFLWPKRDVALVRGVIKHGQQVHVVEVHGRSSIFRRPKIRISVDSEKIAGDDL
jgi:hypothetical protein